MLGTNPQPVGGSISISKFQLVPGTKLGGPLQFFPNFSQYRVPNWVVPLNFFQISVSTGYQIGWSPLIFSKFQLVPGTKLGGPLHFFPNFSQYQVPNWVVSFNFFHISFSTRYQIWWSLSIFFPNFSQYQVPNQVVSIIFPILSWNQGPKQMDFSHIFVCWHTSLTEQQK